MRVAPEAACAARKHRRQQPRVHRINRHSLRNGFNGFLRALPGDHAWLPPSPARRRKRLHDLSACVGAPGPHDFAVRTNAVRPRKKIALGDVRPSHPIPNVRDDREPPLYGERDKRKEATDLGVRSIARGRDTMARRANYADEACTFAYRIESVAEIRSSAQAILRPKPLAKAARQTTIERIRARRSNHDASDTSVRSPQEEHTGTRSRRPIGDKPAAIKIDKSGPQGGS